MGRRRPILLSYGNRQQWVVSDLEAMMNGEVARRKRPSAYRIVELAGSIRKLSSNDPGKLTAPFVTRGFP
jgi:hypothetical protein